MLYRCRRHRVYGHHGHGYHVCGHLGHHCHDDDGPRGHPYVVGHGYGPPDGHHDGGHELPDYRGCVLQAVAVGPSVR